MSSERRPASGCSGGGTVGGAFHDLVLERADAIAATSGRRPEIAGVLRRSEGDFDRILEDSEIVVELIGGTDPARDYVLRALRGGPPRGDREQAAHRAVRRRALRGGARRRASSCASRRRSPGWCPVIRVIQESLAATEITKVFGIVNGTTNFILSEMASTGAPYADALAPRPGARLRGGGSRPTTSAAPTPRRRWRSSRGWPSARPVALADVAYQGITEIQPDDIAYAKELGLSLKLLGVAERRDGGISVRVFPCFLYPRHPLAPVEGPFNAVMVEAPAITEITMSGPGAGGIETASAVLGDVVSILSGRAPVHAARERFEIVRDISSAFYLHLEVADRPGVLASIAEVLGRNEVSVRSVVQRGLGDDARLVMVMHEGPESRFFKALEEIATLEFLRAQPRAIRVIEEEFV